MSEMPNVPPRSWRPLEATQRRVLGVLVEKAKTTPAGYPMSVNAIVAGCNQKNNRDPHTSYDDTDVERALSELAGLKAASEIDWMGRVPKYKHHAHEWLGVTPVELAVMTELLLRGAQPLGELRARAARMEPIADQAALKSIVDALVDRGLVVTLTPPGRGQVVTHALYLKPEMDVVRAHWAGHAGGDEAWTPAAPAAAPAARGDDVTALREEIARLTERVAALESRLGETPEA